MVLMSPVAPLPRRSTWGKSPAFGPQRVAARPTSMASGGVLLRSHVTDLLRLGVSSVTESSLAAGSAGKDTRR